MCLYSIPSKKEARTCRAVWRCRGDQSFRLDEVRIVDRVSLVARAVCFSLFRPLCAVLEAVFRNVVCAVSLEPHTCETGLQTPEDIVVSLDISHEALLKYLQA